MKLSFSRHVLFSLAVSCAAAFSPCARAQEEAPSAPETARRQMALRDAMQELQAARNAYSEKKYSDAVEHYRNALAVIPKAPATERQQKFIRDSLSDALIAKAMDYRSVGRTEEALEFLKEAVELSPDNKRAHSELSRTADPVRTNPALSPQHVGNVEEVERLLTLGYGYIDLADYDKAEQSFRQVLAIDAYNSAAQRGLEAVNKRKQSYADDARNSARSAALAEVDKAWEEPLPVEMTDLAAVAGSHAEQGVVVEDAVAESRVAEALQAMVLPQVVFDEATLPDVVEAIRAQIRRFETEGKSTAGRPINVTANFGERGSESYEKIMTRRVNLNVSDVSVKDLLELLARQTGVTYYVTPLGVEIAYSGKDFGPMVERVYSVAPHFFDAEVGGESDEDDFVSSKVVVKRVNPVQALKEMGISFPEGAHARYDSSNRLLTVRNTPFNQDEIAGLINVPLDSQERSVVLNVMAVEVNEKDLNDLGFEWLLNLSLTDSLYAAGGVMTSAASEGLSAFSGSTAASRDLNAPTPSMTEGLRSGPGVLSSDNMERLISTGSAVRYDQDTLASNRAPGVFSLRGVWNAGDVTMIMRGLSQKKGADMLYNPRLVFSPGADQQVVFTNVREMFYPETYGEPQISSTSFTLGTRQDNLLNGGNRDINAYGVVATAAHPEEFTRFGMTEDSVGGVGAVVQVHDAQVEQDGQLVHLALTVTLNDFEGFINWGSPIESVMTTDDGELGIMKMTLTDNRILKPVFKRHMENTRLAVAPGSVLVMGGLREARSVRYEDKLPILGDLPLVGRLFRSEGEQKTRKAFLMFIKVDLVDPSGRDPKTGARPTDKVED